MIQFFHLLIYDQIPFDMKKQLNTSLKNLVFFSHQNFLIIVQILITRMVKKKGNFWATNLNKMLDAKMLKKVKTKGEAIQMIKVHIQNSENILRNLIKQNQGKRFFMMLNDWINAIHTIPNERIREQLYNIEQFRADAFNLVEQRNSKSGQTNVNQSSVQAKGISSSTKTSGSSNLVGGGNSLTGKNPFAILKASAIASTNNTKFPNNFTNLPKATPPFLDPLEGDAKAKTYTLVLDLDETLIHNVEYANESYFLVRPGCVNFIDVMGKFYEIVIFTAALQDYADQVID